MAVVEITIVAVEAEETTSVHHAVAVATDPTAHHVVVAEEADGGTHSVVAPANVAQVDKGINPQIFFEETLVSGNFDGCSESFLLWQANLGRQNRISWSSCVTR